MKKKSRYIWNFASVLLIVVFSEAIYHFFIAPQKVSRDIYEARIEMECLAKPLVTLNRYGYCMSFLGQLGLAAKSYVYKNYDIDSGKDKPRNIVKVELDQIKVFIQFDIYDTISINDDEVKNYLDKKSKEVLDYKKNEMLPNLHIKTAELVKGIYNIESFYNEYQKSPSPEMLTLVDKKNITLKKLYKLLELKDKEIEKLSNLDHKTIYSLKSTITPSTEIQINKFNRLNYTNILLISLVFGIFLNVFFYLSLEIYRLNKKNS